MPVCCSVVGPLPGSPSNAITTRDVIGCGGGWERLGAGPPGLLPIGEEEHHVVAEWRTCCEDPHRLEGCDDADAVITRAGSARRRVVVGGHEDRARGTASRQLNSHIACTVCRPNPALEAGDRSFVNQVLVGRGVPRRPRLACIRGDDLQVANRRDQRRTESRGRVDRAVWDPKALTWQRRLGRRANQEDRTVVHVLTAVTCSRIRANSKSMPEAMVTSPAGLVALEPGVYSLRRS